MFNIQLYIEGTRMDMFKDESITLNESIKQIQEIDKVFLAYSQTFNLPASKTNNKIFKHYYKFDIVNGFDARFSKEATIELDFLPFKKGRIKLNNVVLKNNAPEQYNITFFDNTVSIKDLFGEDKLNSLTELNDLNETFASSNIKTALQRDPASNDVVVPLITHTKRLYYDSVEHIRSTGNLYFETGGGTNTHGIAWNELKYALRIHKIIEAIETKYSINFTDDFFVSTNAPYYGLFMWLHRKKGVVSAGGQVTEYTKQVDGWTAETGDLGSMIDARTLQIDTSNDLSSFQLSLQRSGTTAYDIRIERNGIEIYSESTITATTKNIDLDGYEQQNATYTVFLTYTQAITFTDIVWTLNDGLSIDTFSIAANYPSGYTLPLEFEFIITEQIPEMKVLDFVTALFKMFNLVAFKKDNGDIYVDTLDNYYANETSSQSPYDITQYLAVEDSTVNVALPYREVTFRYEDTETFFAATHNQLFNQEWGTLDYTQTEVADTVVGEEYMLTLPFAHMKYERLQDIVDFSLTTIQWGYCVDDNQESYIGKPILFYPILNSIEDDGTAEGISFIDSIEDDGTYGTHSEITADIVMPSNSVSFSSSSSTANINFNLEKNEYSRDSSFTGTLFENYYKTYMQNLFNKKRRLIEVDAYLPVKILKNFTLADKFIIGTQEYRINKIQSNLSNGKSKIQLLNIV